MSPVRSPRSAPYSAAAGWAPLPKQSGHQNQITKAHTPEGKKEGLGKLVVTHRKVSCSYKPWNETT